MGYSRDQDPGNDQHQILRCACRAKMANGEWLIEEGGGPVSSFLMEQ